MDWHKKPSFCLLQYSICNEPLIELSNPGASGSLFFVTSDDEFIIKTVQHKEAEFLQKLLPGYYMVSNLRLFFTCIFAGFSHTSEDSVSFIVF